MDRRTFAKTMGGAIAGWFAAPQIAQAIPAAPQIASGAPATLETLLTLSGGQSFSPLVRMAPMPEGMGYNYVSRVENAPAFLPVIGEQCPSATLYSYSMQQQMIRSEVIKKETSGWEEQKGKESKLEGLKRSVSDAWDGKDVDEYLKLCRKQNCGRRRFINGIPTSTLTQSHLDLAYEQLAMDGGLNNPVATVDGAPCLILVCDMMVHRQFIIDDSSPDSRQRTTFNVESHPEICQHLKSVGVGDFAYNSFIHLINMRLPRYFIKNGKMERAPFYTVTNPHGVVVVNPDYINAPIGEAFIFHPDVMTRRHPKPLKEGSEFGEAKWVRRIKYDEEGNKLPEDQQDPNEGHAVVPMMAAWEPRKPQYGVSFLYRRCLDTFCVSSNG